MPTYEFFCDECQQPFDIRASIQEKEKGLHPECPHCGSPITRQVLSTGMFIRIGGSSSFNPPGCAPNAGPGCCG